MTDTNDKTVEVPVELLADWASRMSGFDHGMAEEMRDVIPKPKPRLVAVDLSKLDPAAFIGYGNLLSQPDLLDTLDSVIDFATNSDGSWTVGPNMLKDDIREKFGVDHD